MLNKELIGHACGHLFLLLAPVLRYVIDMIRSQQSAPDSLFTATDQILCAKCGQYAIQPVKVRDTDKVIKNYCYYCYCVEVESRKGLTLISGTTDNILNDP